MWSGDGPGDGWFFVRDRLANLDLYIEYILEHNMGLCLFSSTSKGAANTVCHPEISQTGLLRLW